MAESQTDQTSDLFDNKYRLVKELGRTASSTVFEAEEILLKRKVAIKLLKKSAFPDEMKKRFLQEARILSALQHENIVKILNIGSTANEELYISMELLKGSTLHEYLKQEKLLNREKFSQIFLPVIDALSYAHSKDVVHRDIKPENIMLCKTDADSNVVKVLDFGMSKLSTPGQVNTSTGIMAGTPAYMSPEQCLGKSTDQRSDVYSLACVMYESLAGQPPFFGESTAQILYDHAHKETPSLSEISGSREIPKMLAAAIMKALSKPPENRQASMEEFGKQITAALGSGSYIRRKSTWGLKQTLITLSAVFLVIGLAAAISYKKSESEYNIRQQNAEVQKSEKRNDEFKSYTKLRSALAKASICRENTDYQGSLKLLKPFEEKLDPNNVSTATLYFDLAQSTTGLRDYTASEGYLQKCIDLSQRTNNDELTGTATAELGMVRFYSGKKESAISTFKKALKALGEEGNIQRLVQCHNVLYELSFEKGQRALALAELDDSSRLFSKRLQEFNQDYKDALDMHLNTLIGNGMKSKSLELCHSLLKQIDADDSFATASEARLYLENQVQKPLAPNQIK